MTQVKEGSAKIMPFLFAVYFFVCFLIFLQQICFILLITNELSSYPPISPSAIMGLSSSSVKRGLDDMMAKLIPLTNPRILMKWESRMRRGPLKITVIIWP